MAIPNTTGIVVCQMAGTTQADDNGICQAQSLAAGASATLNGSLVSGGTWDNYGWGYKVKVSGAADESGTTFIIAGKFYASNSAGNFSETITLVGGAVSATSALYATRVTGMRVDSATAGAVTLGLAADACGIPVGLPYGSLYQANYGGTFGGATIQVKKYNALNQEWLPFGTETGETAATVKNYEVPAATVVKAFGTTLSTTSSIGIDFEIIAKQR